MKSITYHEDKDATRRNNLAHAKRSPLIFSEQDQVLLGDWLELAGDGDSYPLVAPYLRAGQSVFVGVDKDAEKIEKLRATYPETGTCRWVRARNLFDELRDRPGQFAEVRVLNLDTCSSVRAAEFGRQVGIALDFAERQFWRLGAFLVIFNYDCMRASEPDVLRALKTAFERYDLGDIDLNDHHTKGASGHPRVNLRIHLGPTWDRTPGLRHAP